MRAILNSRAMAIVLASLLVILGIRLYSMKRNGELGVLPQAMATSMPTIALADASYDWSLQSLDGQTVPFSSFKGKTVFLNFWATWCGPCREELPSIERLYQKIKEKGVEVVAVSWEDPQNVKQFLQNYNFTFPIYTFQRPAPASYSAEGIPVTFIISPSGKIVQKHLDPYNWDQDAIVQQLLSLK